MFGSNFSLKDKYRQLAGLRFLHLQFMAFARSSKPFPQSPQRLRTHHCEAGRQKAKQRRAIESSKPGVSNPRPAEAFRPPAVRCYQRKE
ncbi:unnamed protein product [Ixodes persulcatus]